MTQKDMRESLERLIEANKKEMERYEKEPQFINLYYFEKGFINALTSVCEFYLTEDEE